MCFERNTKMKNIAGVYVRTHHLPAGHEIYYYSNRCGGGPFALRAREKQLKNYVKKKKKRKKKVKPSRTYIHTYTYKRPTFNVVKHTS